MNSFDLTFFGKAIKLYILDEITKYTASLSYFTKSES